MPDLNVRSVDETVLARLREQAAVEGVSLSEWIRTALAERAELPTAGELAARRAARAGEGQSREEFAAYYRERLHRRRTS
jgi:antitoxin FitA-like protein